MAKSENGRNAQQINIYFNNSIFDLNKAHGNNTCIRRSAERTRYSFSESYPSREKTRWPLNCTQVLKGFVFAPGFMVA